METPEMQTAIQDHEQRLRELEDAIKQIAAIAEMAGRHEKILKGGDRAEDVGLQEMVRNIDRNQKSTAYWARAIAMLFLAQFVAVIFAGIALFIKVLPVLISLSNP
jgi:hypothetical protein